MILFNSKRQSPHPSSFQRKKRSLSGLQNYMEEQLKEKYGTSQIYFHAHLIDNLVQCTKVIIKGKKKCPTVITFKDLKFDEEE